ncbi:MAG: ATP-binding protein [Gammaproteobacteria bacterium]|nr:ATP-binding protein [Gammaproteobacteria bacterium]
MLPIVLFTLLFGVIITYVIQREYADYLEYESETTRNSVELAYNNIRRKVTNLQEHIHITNVSRTVQDHLLVGNQFEVLNAIIDIYSRSGMDLLGVYDNDGLPFAKAHSPGEFGIEDSLSVWVQFIAQSEKNEFFYNVITADGSQLMLVGKAMTDLNGRIGVTIAGYNLNHEFLGEVSAGTGSKLAIKQESSAISDDRKLSRYLITTEFAIPEYPLTFELRETRSPDKENFFERVSIVFSSLIILTSAALFFSYSILRKIEVRIRSLSGRVNAISEGNFDFSPIGQAINTEDELGSLESDIESMQKTIIARTNEINFANRALSEEVEIRKEAESKAVKASQAKSNFMSSMSHELRTPLNAILGFSQLMQLEEEDESKLENIEQILIAGNHLLELVNQVLEIQRIESGDLTTVCEVFSVRSVIEECAKMIKPVADQNHIELRIDLDEEVEPVVNADKRHLKQILINLLSNSVKYNSVNGSVRIKTDTIDGKVRISVKDSGRGLTKQQQDNLFVPFNRAGAENSIIPGTGLGLSITKHLAESMNGEVGVISEINKGSEFWVQLPLAVSVRTNEPFTPEMKSAGGAGAA